LEIPFLKILIKRVEITPRYYIVASYVALDATQQILKNRNHHPSECMALASPDSFYVSFKTFRNGDEILPIIPWLETQLSIPRTRLID
jgi:hypothetical protein